VSDAAVTIREGRREDAPFLAWAILTASRGHLSRGWFDFALSRPECECLAFLGRLAVTRTPSLWHYSCFSIAEVDGSPVAAVSALRAADAYPTSPIAIAETAEALGLPLDERARIWERGQYAFTCTIPPNDACLIIENVATLPTFRRRGCIAALLAQAVESGRAQGLHEAQITFLIGNDSAERAYLKAGFRFASESRHPDFQEIAGSPGLRRFVRAL